MTPLQLLDATQGKGENCLYRIKDDTRMMAIFLDGYNLIVGFGGTRPNFFDWISNVNPETEALEHIPVIREMIRIYQPTLVFCVGHSQGGAHAEIVAKHFDAEIVTFGGLPYGGIGTHYLARKDPMAWLPVRRVGRVIKIGSNGLPDAKCHAPAHYRQLLTALIK